MPSDAAIIASIGQCVWIHTYSTEGVNDPISKYVLKQFTEENIRNVISTRCVFILGNNGHYVGYCVLNKGKAPEIETLYILPRYQNRGYGTQLLKHVLAECKPVTVSTWEKNEFALNFYRKNGFIEDGEVFFELEDEKHRNVKLKYHT